MLTYSTFIPGETNSPEAIAAGAALDSQLAAENPEMPYSQMMRFRLNGSAAAECRDAYFITTDAGNYVARLWHGWGWHADAVGNFGNFKTSEAYQRQGIGGKLLDMWFADLHDAATPPLGLFCTATPPHLVELYGRFGFRPALAGSSGGPLYCPLGDSPPTFQEFCAGYYRPASSLRFVPGTVGFRHEIDCLLRFALLDAGETFGLVAIPSYEMALLAPNGGRLERIVTDQEHTVGWAFTAAGQNRELQVHPSYRGMSISEKGIN